MLGLGVGTVAYSQVSSSITARWQQWKRFGEAFIVRRCVAYCVFYGNVRFLWVKTMADVFNMFGF